MRGWLSSFPVPRCSIRSNHGSKHSSILASKSMKPAFTRSGILLHVFLATSYGLGWPSGFWSFVILGKSVQGCEWRMWWGEAPMGKGKCAWLVSPQETLWLFTSREERLVEPQDSSLFSAQKTFKGFAESSCWNPQLPLIQVVSQSLLELLQWEGDFYFQKPK